MGHAGGTGTEEAELRNRGQYDMNKDLGRLDGSLS